MKQQKIELIYITSTIAAFALMFFSNADRQFSPNGHAVQLGMSKAFYFPCAIALVTSVFLRKRWDVLDKSLIVMIGLVLISSLIHPQHGASVLSWTLTRFVFAILCFKDIRNVDPLKFAKTLAWISPLIVFPHYILSNPFSYGEHRYLGFYGDSNFLSMALNLVIVLCYIAFQKSETPGLRVISVCSIVGAIPLILLGQSRSGVIGLVLILLFILWTIWESNKKLCYSLVAILFIASGFVAKYCDTFSRISSRFESALGGNEESCQARIDGIVSVCNVMTNCPRLIPCGIGLGNTIPEIEQYREHGYITKYVVHNTDFSLLYEAGLIVTILYLSIYFHIIRQLWRDRNYLLLGLLLSGIVSLTTLPGVCFMPAWIMLFYISNKRINEVNIRRLV